MDEQQVVQCFGAGAVSGTPRLNVGCGRYGIPGWVNLDKFGYQRPAIVADLERDLPFADNTFAVILASHVLEHVGDVVTVVAELNRVLKPGGRLLIAVPYGWSDSGAANPFHRVRFTEHTFTHFLESTYTELNSAGTGAHEGKRFGRWASVKVDLVPYPQWMERAATDPDFHVWRKRHINIIRELQAVMTKES